MRKYELLKNYPATGQNLSVLWASSFNIKEAPTLLPKFRFNSFACLCYGKYTLLHHVRTYRGADKSLARPSSRCILFDGDNILFDASLVLYLYIQGITGGKGQSSGGCFLC